MADAPKRLMQVILKNSPAINVFTMMSATEIDNEMMKDVEDSKWIDLLGVDDFDNHVPTRFLRKKLIGYMHGKYEPRMVNPVGRPGPGGLIQ